VLPPVPPAASIATPSNSASGPSTATSATAFPASAPPQPALPRAASQAAALPASSASAVTPATQPPSPPPPPPPTAVPLPAPDLAPGASAEDENHSRVQLAFVRPPSSRDAPAQPATGTATRRRSGGSEGGQAPSTAATSDLSSRATPRVETTVAAAGDGSVTARSSHRQHSHSHGHHDSSRPRSSRSRSASRDLPADAMAPVVAGASPLSARAGVPSPVSATTTLGVPSSTAAAATTTTTSASAAATGVARADGSTHPSHHSHRPHNHHARHSPGAPSVASSSTTLDGSTRNHFTTVPPEGATAPGVTSGRSVTSDLVPPAGRVSPTPSRRSHSSHRSRSSHRSNSHSHSRSNSYTHTHAEASAAATGPPTAALAVPVGSAAPRESIAPGDAVILFPTTTSSTAPASASISLSAAGAPPSAPPVGSVLGGTPASRLLGNVAASNNGGYPPGRSTPGAPPTAPAPPPAVLRLAAGISTPAAPLDVPPSALRAAAAAGITLGVPAFPSTAPAPAERLGQQTRGRTETGRRTPAALLVVSAPLAASALGNGLVPPWQCMPPGPDVAGSCWSWIEGTYSVAFLALFPLPSPPPTLPHRLFTAQPTCRHSLPPLFLPRRPYRHRRTSRHQRPLPFTLPCHLPPLHPHPSPRRSTPHSPAPSVGHWLPLRPG